MKLPEITPLQFLVLQVLFDGRKTTDELRRELATRGLSCSAPAMSKLMKRLVAAAFVQPRFRQRSEGKHAVQDRSYQVTDLGVILWKATRDFYAAAPLPPEDIETAISEEAEFAHLERPRRKALLEKEYVRRFEKLAEAIGRGLRARD